MATLMLALARDEVEQAINYRLIATAMCSALWQTGQRRRRWAAEFSETERHACSRLKTQAFNWYLKTGVPDEVILTTSTLALWKKLEAFCASL